jgi:hypothetical protein
MVIPSLQNPFIVKAVLSLWIADGPLCSPAPLSFANFVERLLGHHRPSGRTGELRRRPGPVDPRERSAISINGKKGDRRAGGKNGH